MKRLLLILAFFFISGILITLKAAPAAPAPPPAINYTAIAIASNVTSQFPNCYACLSPLAN